METESGAEAEALRWRETLRRSGLCAGRGRCRCDGGALEGRWRGMAADAGWRVCAGGLPALQAYSTPGKLVT
jgi:hypothetical protein